MSEGDRTSLDIYFKSKRFLKRLDDIRHSTDDPTTLKAYAFGIGVKLKLLHAHIGIILHYLETGQYEPSKGSSGIEIVDKGRRIVPLTPHPEKTFKWVRELDDIGVSLELTENTTRDELKAFIDKNWRTIKGALDANYAGRKKRFTPVLRIDTYLAIADALSSIENGSKRARMAADLAAKYNMDITEVRRAAKEYRSILVE